MDPFAALEAFVYGALSGLVIGLITGAFIRAYIDRRVTQAVRHKNR